MTKRDLKCPIVFKDIKRIGAGVAAQHSQCLGAWDASSPGLKVISSYNARDNIGLLRALIRDPDPQIILENKIMYRVKFDVTEEDFDPNFCFN
jgi:pyruvate dehydrogenase E1 component beta subunit